MRRVRFREAATAEFREAIAWYEGRDPDIAALFCDSVDIATTRLSRHPEAFQVVYRDLRRCMVPRFPYSLIYRLRADDIEVLAVFNHHRRPADWEERGDDLL